jgi:hypothetical protein
MSNILLKIPQRVSMADALIMWDMGSEKRNATLSLSSIKRGRYVTLLPFPTLFNLEDD